MSWFVGIVFLLVAFWYFGYRRNDKISGFINSLFRPNGKPEEYIKSLKDKADVLEVKATNLERIKEQKLRIKQANERVKRARE